MASYELTHEAERDMDGIFGYTVDTWGLEQAITYKTQLERAFASIVGDKIKSRFISPQFRYLSVGHHYVFYEIEKGKAPLILAVFHERMNLVKRFKERLKGMG